MTKIPPAREPSRVRFDGPSETYLRVAAEARLKTGRSMLEVSPFHDRGLNDRTITALIDGGVDAPERLLFMTPAQLRGIPGIGKAAFAEITKYRSRFLPE